MPITGINLGTVVIPTIMNVIVMVVLSIILSSMIQFLERGWINSKGLGNFHLLPRKVWILKPVLQLTSRQEMNLRTKDINVGVSQSHMLFQLYVLKMEMTAFVMGMLSMLRNTYMMERLFLILMKPLVITGLYKMLITLRMYHVRLKLLKV